MQFKHLTATLLACTMAFSSVQFTVMAEPITDKDTDFAPIMVLNNNDVLSSSAVTFELNGGTADFDTEQSVTVGEAVTEPANSPTRTGYSFEGWYTDTGYTKPYDFSTPITEDGLTLYARWLKQFSMTIQPSGTDVDTNTEPIDVYANDEVQIYVYADCEAAEPNFTNAEWKLKYNPAEFQFVSAELLQGTTYVNKANEGDDTFTTYVLGTTGKDEYLTGADNKLVVYTFKALPQTKDFVPSDFIISETYVDSYNDAGSSDKVPAANNDTVTVNIINRSSTSGSGEDSDFDFDIESVPDGDEGQKADITADGINQVYDGKTYTVVGTPTATVEGAVVTYSVDNFVTETDTPLQYKNITNSTAYVKAVAPGYSVITKSVPIVITQRKPEVTFDYNILDTQAITSDIEFTVTLSNLVDDSYCGVVWVDFNDKSYAVDVTYDPETNTSTGTATVKNAERGFTAQARYAEGVNDNYSSAESEEITTHNYYIEVVNNTERNAGVQDYVSSIADEGNGFIYVLVYTNEDNLYFNYEAADGKDLMYEVTAAGYHYTDDNLVSYDNMFSHIYGLVVPATGEPFNPNDYRSKVSVAENITAEDINIINTYNEDINFTNVIDVNDVTADFAVYNGNANYLSTRMHIVLKGDVNRDKLVDIKDINLIKKAAHIE